MIRSHRLVVALVMAVAALPQLGCSGGKYDSPEACFRTMQVAAHNQDWSGVCACLTDESQEQLSGMLVMVGNMLKMQKDSTPIVDALKKHGITDEALQSQGVSLFSMPTADSLRGLATLVKDKSAFITDMIVAMQQLSSAAQFSEQFTNQIAGELQDVQVTGDRATAVTVTEKTKTPIEFRKTPAGWKRSIELDTLGLGNAMPSA